MTWKEVAALPANIVVGSHGCRHTVLTQLDPMELEREIRESRNILEERVRQPVKWFSYPDGRLNTEVLSRVHTVYRAACGMSPGWVATGVDPFDLPRINADFPVSAITWNLHATRGAIQQRTARGK